MGSFWSAAAYVGWRSAVNRAKLQLRRLREPRYAVGVSAAVAYLWFGVSRWGNGTAGHLGWSALGLEIVALLGLAGGWVFGGDDAVIRFTEAEIQHLFPAPVTRRGLLAYKIARGALASVPYALVATVFIGGRLTDHHLFFAIGAWIGFLGLDLHASAASLTRAAVVDAGLAGFRRRVVTAGVLLAAVLTLGWAATRITPPHLDGTFSTAADWAAQAIVAPPLGYLLLPVRIPIEVALAQDPVTFGRALPLALVVLLLHAVWLLGSPAAFEDGTVRAAERTAVRKQGASQGMVLRLGSLRFPLAATGRPEVALIWKGVIASFRLAPIRLAVGVGTMLLAIAIIAFGALGNSPGGASASAAVVALSIAGYLALFGSGLLRVDLRLDLAEVELLRSLPLSGRALVTGELLGPALVLAAGQWLCLLAAAGLSVPWPGDPPLSMRLGTVGALAVALPVLTLCSLVVQNGAALLFPEWERQGGFDAVGRRLLTLLTNLVVAAVALGPGMVFAAPALVLMPWLGGAALPLAAALGAVPVLALLWLAIGRMGRWMEALDPSAK